MITKGFGHIVTALARARPEKGLGWAGLVPGSSRSFFFYLFFFRRQQFNGRNEVPEQAIMLFTGTLPRGAIALLEPSLFIFPWFFRSFPSRLVCTCWTCCGGYLLLLSDP